MSLLRGLLTIDELLFQRRLLREKHRRELLSSRVEVRLRLRLERLEPFLELVLRDHFVRVVFPLRVPLTRVARLKDGIGGSEREHQKQKKNSMPRVGSRGDDREATRTLM
eukprot:30087-Pelagococcus_subviridis.AAC.26